MTQVRTHFVAALTGTAVSQLIAGIAQVLIVRTLGATQYGTYALLYAWLAIVTAIIGAGLDLWLLDYGSRHPKQIWAAIRRIITIKLVVVSGCGVLFVSGIIPSQVATHLLILGLVAVTADSISASVWQSLRAANQHRTVAVIQSSNMLLILVAVFAGAASRVETILAAQACIAVTVCTVSWLVSRRTLLAQSMQLATSLRAGVPFVISDVCAQLYTYSGTLLLAQFVSIADVGVYRGAWSIIGYSFVIPAVILNTTLPQLNAAHAVTERRRIIAVAAGLHGIYAVAMWLVATMIAPTLLPLLYGASFQSSAQFVAQLAIIPVAKAASFLGVMLLIQQQHLRTRIGVQLAVVALLWLITPTLIAQAGIRGAIQAQIWCEVMLAAGYLTTGILRMRLIPAATHTPRHIYICNMHGVSNVGDLAIHQAQLAMLVARFPQAQLTLAYAHTTAAQRLFPHHHVIRGISHWVYDTNGQIAPWTTRMRRTAALLFALPILRWGGKWRMGLNADEYAALAAIAHADLVCASGGGYLYDTPHRAGLWRWLSWDWFLLADMAVAVSLGRPLVLLPQSIGPIHNRWLRWGLRWVTRHATHVYARESQSAQWLTQHGIPHQLASDMAWRLSAPARGAPNTTPHVLGITAIDWGAQYAGFRGQAAYEQLLCDVIKHYLALGWRVHIFVQCQDSNPAWDDTHVARRIIATLAHPAVVLMPFIADPAQLQQAYAQLDRMLTTRLHAAILRLACNQPCVVIGYLPKTQGIMHDIGLAAWCLDIHTTDTQTVISALDTSEKQYPLLAQRQYLPTVFESESSEYPSADQP